jgi:hypothetical protein
MSAPYDRATSEPGGCECYECGVIFVGAEHHTICGVCHRVNTAAEAERAAIVAWLRSRKLIVPGVHQHNSDRTSLMAADAIESGSHLKGNEG